MREMKDSGVEWIGKIPQGWTVSKLKYSSQFFNGDRGKNYPSGNDLVDDGVIFLTSNNLHEDVLDTSYENSKYITEERYNILGGAKLRINDIVFCLRGSVGNCSINKTETQGTVASSLMTIRPQQSNADFVNYMLHSEVTYSQTRLFVNGSCAENLSADNVANYYFVEPPLAEQKQIATYLHSKCANIDTIISDIQLQIELLQEYKQSVITEAVTKGLDKNVAMKDCGVEWIGKISSKANIIRLKHFSYMKGRIGWQGLKSTDFIDEGPYCITGTDFINGQVNWDTCYHVSEERYQMDPYIQVKIGDLLVTKDGTIGKMAIISKLPNKACLNSHLLIVRPLNNKFTNKYLYYVMLSDIFSHYYSLVSNGSTMDSLSQEKMGNFSFPIYNIDIQHIITDYLDRKCAEIDAVLADKQKQLDTLTEYKKSLIYEYVTGKKEVPADA